LATGDYGILSRNMQHHMVKLLLKRVYVSEYLSSTIHTRFQMIVAMAENREWANCLPLSCNWRWLAICLVNSEFTVAPGDCTLNALQWSLSSPRDTFFRDRSDPEFTEALSNKRNKMENRKKKKETKRAIKDHKNDWLTDAICLKLVMKNKWTRW